MLEKLKAYVLPMIRGEATLGRAFWGGWLLLFGVWLFLVLPILFILLLIGVNEQNLFGTVFVLNILYSIPQAIWLLAVWRCALNTRYAIFYWLARGFVVLSALGIVLGVLEPLSGRPPGSSMHLPEIPMQTEPAPDALPQNNEAMPIPAPRDTLPY